MDHVATFWLLLFVMAGLYLLIRGADHLVDGASSLALHAGVSPLMVGLTIVAFGTSAPELATCLSAVAHGTSPGEGIGAAQFALGNVVGSNIANLALILGCAGLLVPLEVESSLVRRELPFLAALSFAFAGLVMWWGLGRVPGSLLLLAFLGFIAWAAHETLRQRRSRKGAGPAHGDEALEEEVDVERLEHLPSWQAVLLVGLGLLVLTVGAELLVRSATALAQRLHVPDEFIGLTIVALGTSLPELATTLVAARKSSIDIALGNVVGSNIFNIGLVVGLPAVLFGWPVDADGIRADLAVMLFFTLVVVLVAVVRRRLTRRTGIALLAGYALYIGALVVEVVRS